VSEVGLAFVDHPSGALAPAAIVQTRMLVSPGEPAQWQDDFGQARGYFGNLLARGHILGPSFERLRKARLTKA